MLIIESRGGLANRMQGIGASYALTRSLARPLLIVWQQNPALGAPWDALFEPLPDASVVQFDINRQGSADRDRYVNGLKPDLCINHALDEFLRLSDPEKERVTGEQFSPENLARYERVHVFSWRLFYRTEQPFAPFKPIPELRQAIDEIASTFDRTMGVHIRRGDHSFARQHTPTALMIARMQRALDDGEAESFFLATDDAGEEETLHAAFPGLVKTALKRSLDRASTEGIQDAVVDLYALSRTTKVLGSAGSTYSNVAQKLGGIQMEIMKSF